MLCHKTRNYQQCRVLIAIGQTQSSTPQSNLPPKHQLKPQLLPCKRTRQPMIPADQSWWMGCFPLCEINHGCFHASLLIFGLNEHATGFLVMRLPFRGNSDSDLSVVLLLQKSKSALVKVGVVVSPAFLALLDEVFGQLPILCGKWIWLSHFDVSPKCANPPRRTPSQIP